MVRVAKRPLAQQSAAAQTAGDRLDHAEFERLGRFERRQDARQPRRQHRFARAGRSDHQQIVGAGGGDFERAFGALLALHVLQVEAGGARRRQFRLGRRQQLRALEMVDDRQQVRRRDDLDLAGPGRLAAARARADDAGVARRGRERGDQDAGHRRQRAVERDLAERDVAGQLVLRQNLHFGEQPERDRQIEMAAFLEDVGRREVYRDAARRQRETERRQRGAHPLARLGDRLVRQADDREGRQPRGNRHLGFDVDDLDPEKRHGADPRHHVPAPPLRARRGRQDRRAAATATVP